jgi:exodeoxyribonuclease-1
MTFYFYDLETSGINPRAQRIMQFAGQRTDADLNPIGEPQNWLVKLTDEVLPDPDAVLITGITPQKTHEEGYTEAEFLQLFTKEVLQPDTVICGFNTIRFDDEFMRATLWRNFYDPYEWQWQDGRSRWDLLDVVRMVRALRPEGIEWPFEERLVDSGDHGKQETAGKKTVRVPTNRLELLTKANGLNHDNAHDALSDVHATIAVAKLLKEKQPQMFEYLLKMRDKKQVKTLVDLEDKRPFVYTSGRYESQYQKTTVAFPLTSGRYGNVIVYDLRYDPTPFLELSEKEIADKVYATWEQRKQEGFVKLPIKELQPNRAPAVAPLGVLTQNDGWNKVSLREADVQKHLKALLANAGFAERVRSVMERGREFGANEDPDFQLYDGFVGDQDKTKMRAVRAADEQGLADMNLDFSDQRLEQLLPRYKTRNFPRSITASEREAWEAYRTKRLVDGCSGQQSLAQFAKRLGELSKKSSQNEQIEFLLQELQLYAESIAPILELD